MEFDITASDQYHRKGLDQNIAEFTTQLNAEGSGILLPWAFCRQQTLCLERGSGTSVGAGFETNENMHVDKMTMFQCLSVSCTDHVVMQLSHCHQQPVTRH